MTTETRSNDPALADLYWAGPSGYAVLPTVIIGGVLSPVVLLGMRPLSGWFNLSEEGTSFLHFGTILVPWLIAGAIWTYRSASFVYRLTPTHLHVDYGMLFRPFPPIAMAEIVAVTATRWQRWLRFGTVIVNLRGRPRLKLRHVHRPELFAAAIARQAKL